MEQTVSVVSASGSMATPYIPHSVLDEHREEPRLIERERLVSFGSIFYALSRTSGNGGQNGGHNGNGGMIGAGTQTA